MKTIIAGSRGITDYITVLIAIKEARVEKGIIVSEVVSGRCYNSPDMLGEEFAVQNTLPIQPFPADWNKLGKKAGTLRNIQMAEYADALIAVWDGKSRGTAHMIDCATRNKLNVYIYDISEKIKELHLFLAELRGSRNDIGNNQRTT